MRKICILGSTGSIGIQTLDVVKNINKYSNNQNDMFDVVALSANSSIEIIEKQIYDFKPEVVVVTNDKAAYELQQNLNKNGCKTEVLTGNESLNTIASLSNIDTVVNALVGNVGLSPTITAIRAGKNIALANKETLVTAGEIVMKEASENNVSIYPIDSEHSAIFQCIDGNHKNNISKIHLTASGGPFREFKDLSNITLKDALKHPNWNMGKKITIDSSTLMNKGLEVIEAKWLFNVELDKINVVVHPQSIIHSMVEFEDGAVIAQLGMPDMKIPIQYALTYPKRIKSDFPKIDFFSCGNLTFEKPNIDVFKCLNLAFEAIKIGGTLPAVLNASNEVAVNSFLNNEISFIEIPMLIEKAMNAYNVNYNYSLEDVFQADLWARNFTHKQILMR